MTEAKLKIAFAALVLVAHTYAAEGQPFDYDKNAPIDLKEQLADVRDGIRVSFVNHVNPKGGRAYGMLVVPPQIKSKTAAIVWAHSSSFYSQLPDAILMARDGAISLLLELSASTDSGDAARLEMLRTVISLRRGVDILAARPDVDPQRIGFVGHSYGAMIGTVAAAVDKRFKAAVFEVGLLGMSIHIRTSPHPWAESVRTEKGDKLEEFLAAIEPLDAGHYVGHLAPTALLFQSARLDLGVPDKDAQEFFDAASEPKQLKWYDTGHEVLDIAAISDRARFLSTQLHLPPIEPILKAKIGLK
jgi:dienelactone hydrolase